MAQDAQTKLYEDQARRLLYLDSVQDIALTIRDIRNQDVAKLHQAFSLLEEHCLAENLAAQHRLVVFVREVVDEILHPAAGSAPPGVAITNVDELIKRALSAATPLRAYRILRAHRHFLDAHVLKSIEQQVAAHRPDAINAASWLMLCCLVALLLKDKAIVARGYLFWASYCRRNGNYQHAARYLARVRMLADELNDNNLQLLALSSLASLYERMGEETRATEIYLEALAFTQRSGADVMASDIRRRLANLYRGAGRYSEALDHIDAYIPLVQREGAKEQELGARLLRGLLLEDLGRYEEGEAEYWRAEQLASSLGDRGNQFVAMTNAAGSYLKRGNVREGVNRFRAIQRTVERWGNPYMIAATHNNLGNALLKANHPSAALAEFRQALNMTINTGDRDGEAITFLGMGDALKALGNNEAAQTFYTMLLIPYGKTGNINFLFFYISRLRDSAITEDAIETIQDALEQARREGRGFYEMLLISFLADQYQQKGDEQQALALYREGIERGKKREAQAPEVLHLQVRLARLLSRHPENNQEAYSILTETLASIEQELSKVTLDQRRAEIISDWIVAYGALIDLLVNRSASNSTQDDPLEAAFNLHEAAKARSFISSLANTTIPLPASVPQPLQEREAQLLALEHSFQNPPQESGSPAYRLQRLQEISAELQACWAEMRPFAPEYVQLRTGEPATFYDLQALLSTHAESTMAFISFFCAEDSTFCFVVRSDEKRLQVFQCPVGRAELDKAVLRLRRAFNGAANEFPPYPPIRGNQPWKRDKDLAFLDEISRALLQFLPAVQGIELLCVAPHGPLHLLPLHALKTADGKFLIEQFALTYCPSLSTLRYCLARNRRSLPLAQPSVYVAGVASRDDLHPEFFEHDDQIFDSHVWHTTIDTGIEAAARYRVLQQSDNHDIIHLTCHGYFNERDPLGSGLLFSDGRDRPPRDLGRISVMERGRYLVTARDLLRRRMNAALVTLRACSTGLQAHRNQGDEFEGLSRALLYAGNATIIVSLWNVDQQSSQQLITRFYRHWATTEPPLEKWRALWKAQKDFLAESEQPYLQHPYHWAPLVLIGDWR